MRVYQNRANEGIVKKENGTFKYSDPLRNPFYDLPYFEDYKKKNPQFYLDRDRVKIEDIKKQKELEEQNKKEWEEQKKQSELQAQKDKLAKKEQVSKYLRRFANVSSAVSNFFN